MATPAVRSTCPHVKRRTDRPPNTRSLDYGCEWLVRSWWLSMPRMDRWTISLRWGFGSLPLALGCAGRTAPGPMGTRLVVCRPFCAPSPTGWQRGVSGGLGNRRGGSSIGLFRVGRVRGWGEWVFVSMACRAVVRSLRRSRSRLGPGDRMRPPSVAPSLDGVAAVRLGRGHHGGHSGVTHGSSCSRTRGHAGWSGFSSGERADPSCVFAVGLFWFAWPVGWW